MESRCSSPTHAIECSADGICDARQFTARKCSRLFEHALQLRFGNPTEYCRSAIYRGSVHHDEVAQTFEQIFNEPPRVLPGLDNTVTRLECCGRIADGERFNHRVQQLSTRESEQTSRPLQTDMVPLAASDELIKDAQGVAH